MNRYQFRQIDVEGSTRAPISFVEQPTGRPQGKRQARLRNRVQLMPELDLTAYECRAVVDWVEVRFCLCRPTQGVAINSHLRKELGQSIHVKEEGDNQTFRLRVQELASSSFLDKLVDAMHAKWGLRCEPDVMGLEISVDFRPKVHSVEALDRLFGVLVRTHFPGRDVMARKNDRPRSGWKEGRWTKARSVLPWTDSRATRSHLAITTAENHPAVLGATFYEGEKDSESMWRVMIKQIDQQSIAAGTRRELPEEEHRVRIEVTLDFRELHKLGITTLAELKTFRYQTFQRGFFQFRLPTFRDVGLKENSRHSTRAIEVTRRLKFLRAGVVGLRAMDDALLLGQKKGRARLEKKLGRKLAPKKRTGTGSSSTLVSYEKLSERVAMALRNLGERMVDR